MADIEVKNLDIKLTKTNITSIEKDTERLRKLKEESNVDDVNFENDDDDLSEYTHMEDGVKILNDTSTINRKAIFHDLDRIKHWRESMDKEKDVLPEKPTEQCEKHFTPIMEKNVDEILNQLPSVGTDVVESDASVKRLEEIEGKLKRGYTLDGS